jgi:hypothetical protein
MDIDPPADTIVTEQAFANDANANAVLQGIYISLNPNGANFSNGRLTAYLGAYADELVPFVLFDGDPNADVYYNLITAGNLDQNPLWNSPYKIIYQLNTIEENVPTSTGITANTKNSLLGEAKFLRALLYFYLVNLYGDVPYVNSTSWAETARTPRTPQAEVYRNLINDLLSAQATLADDFSAGGGEKIRANRWAATALLARCYLYQSQWDKAEIEATKIITQNQFKLSNTLNGVFEKNSQEAILQWNANTKFPPFNVTSEGMMINPYLFGQPQFRLSETLVNDFEPGDQRRTAWIKSTTYLGQNYDCPNKYKLGPGMGSPNATATEYYTVLRLAEQYLIRAESRAYLNKLTNAIDDVNMIRKRAGLSDLPYSLNQTQILAAIAQERRVEFFAEWGHRWLDLKRTGKADQVMAIASPLKNGGIAWQPYRKLLPIPQVELNKSPFLTQNPGYNF